MKGPHLLGRTIRSLQVKNKGFVVHISTHKVKTGMLGVRLGGQMWPTEA
jgi:hypothetical protein